MRRLSNSLLIGSMGPGDLLTAACPDRKNIAEIERDPGRYQNKLWPRGKDSYAFDTVHPLCWSLLDQRRDGHRICLCHPGLGSFEWCPDRHCGRVGRRNLEMI